MKLLFRVPLFWRIMVWFFMNLVLLAVVLLFVFNLNLRFDRGAPQIFGRAPNRLEFVAHLLSSETQNLAGPDRERVLQQVSLEYGVEFFIFDATGSQLAGREISVPDEVSLDLLRMPRFPGPPPGMAPGRPGPAPPPFAGEPPPPSDAAPGPGVGAPEPGGAPGPRPPVVFRRSSNPTKYWASTPLFLFEPDAAGPRRATLLAVSDSFTGNGLFFDPKPWLIVVAVIAIVSILFWFPFVRGISRSIAQMTRATEQIAEEQFDVRVKETRGDEIGRLGTAINHLAQRLAGFVSGQKRFLGDISHELNSPLARMNVALSILDQRVAATERPYVEDVREELEVMSRLVDELLAYARAGIKGARIALEPVALRALIETVVRREAVGADSLEIRIDAGLTVMAQAELLTRALSNLLRNAVRYAGVDARIEIIAAAADGHVRITVMDDGPGVPESELEKLFDPFHRIESDRARATGGAGLGMAIVRSCIETCGGAVTAKNRTPAGLEVNIMLTAG